MLMFFVLQKRWLYKSYIFVKDLLGLPDNISVHYIKWWYVTPTSEVCTPSFRHC